VVSFVPDVTEAERTWEGRMQVQGEPWLMEAWLTKRRGRRIVNLGRLCAVFVRTRRRLRA